MKRYHLNSQGNVGLCRALHNCPFGDSSHHYSSPTEARSAYEKMMTGERVTSQRLESFSPTSFYGEMTPLPIQLDALNGVARALEKEDQTQLVAACGTGKTYMGRQLMRHLMEEEGSTGIGVVLTSSIKLAQDTAADLRPGHQGQYDHSFGKFGKDYEVIEVHSSARMVKGKQSVLEGGVISTERIHRQLSEALAAGKKVIIVSTYDSSHKVREAQETFEDAATVRADLIMHDEAHNILGQQRPTTTPSDETENLAYTGFHDSIPRAIQARKRLYTTATPVIREGIDDRESTATVEAAREVAVKMVEDKWERVTFYSSDSDVVGTVGGYISLEAAVSANCLSQPEYELRDVLVESDDKLADAHVDPRGCMVEKAEAGPNPLTIQTYAALTSTLEAMAEDAEEGKNSVSNVLAYCGSIEQSESFRDNFGPVALELSGQMELGEAETFKDSPQPDLRRRARMRLLAEYATVLAAHSRSDGASVREKTAAYKMFSGHAPTAEEDRRWSPHKRALANVDIFSEGVSIPEIDTVVISDDEKCSESAMTQAIGRSIRKVRGNGHKNTGHVIVPRALDRRGRELNGGSVAVAAYGATRVERGMAIAKLRGEKVGSDHTTSFREIRADGSRRTILASDLAQGQQESLADVVAAHDAQQIHRRLLATNQLGYREKDTAVRHQLIMNVLQERATSVRADAHRSEQVLHHLSSKTHWEVASLRRGSRVISSAIASGDVGALSPAISSGLIRSGILKPLGELQEVEPTFSEKKELLSHHGALLAGALASKPKEMGETHQRLREVFLSDGTLPQDVMRATMGANDVQSAQAAAAYGEKFKAHLEDENFVNDVYGLLSDGEARSHIPIFGSLRAGRDLAMDVEKLDSQVHERQTQAARQGEDSYTFDASKLRKTGDLNASAVASLAQLAWGD